MQSEIIDQLIILMQARLDEVRKNLLTVELDAEHLWAYRNAMEQLKFDRLLATHDQLSQLECLRRQYVTLFNLYM